MKKVAILLLGTVVLTGCGSDDSGDTVSSHVQANVIEGTIESINPLADEVTMNGVDYHVTSITFGKKDDISLNDLKANMMVKLSTNNEASTFTVNNATLTLEPTMVGVITNINKDTGDFKINGMVLSAEKSMLAEIDNNDWVMISSLPTANAGYHVLSIVKFESDPLNGEVEMEGIVNHLNDNKFTLGSNFTVTYNQAAIEDNIRLSNGQWVEVTGSMVGGTTLVASEIEVDDYDDLDQNTDIEGIISWVEKDKSSFELNYKGRFVVNNNTTYDDGAQNDLVVGKRVEVTAKMVDGINQAFEIEFEDADNDLLEPEGRDLQGNIVSIDLNATSPFFVIKTIRENKTVFLTTRTEFDDHLTAGTLRVGMTIEVETYLVNDQYMAIEIEEYDND